MIKVELEKFEGPLDLLLRLIEGSELDICEISLSQITDAYLVELERIDKPSNEMAEFVVIAAKLLYIKSKQLLPSVVDAESEQEIADLEAALSEYQKYKEAAKYFENMLSKNERSFSRKARQEKNISFVPPKNLDNSKLWQIFNNVLSRVEVRPEIKTVKPIKISIGDKKREILLHVKKRGRVSFRSLFNKKSSKTEVIVVFLAILEMIKQKEIAVRQNQNFADFVICGVK